MPRSTRCTFNAAYRLCIVEEADQYAEHGQIGAILRRGRLYSSQLATWRRQREAGELQAMAPKKPGRKAGQDAKDVEIAALRRENECLQQQLAQAELIIGVQKKLAESLEQTLTGSEGES